MYHSGQISTLIVRLQQYGHVLAFGRRRPLPKDGRQKRFIRSICDSKQMIILPKRRNSGQILSDEQRMDALCPLQGAHGFQIAEVSDDVVRDIFRQPSKFVMPDSSPTNHENVFEFFRSYAIPYALCSLPFSR